MHIRKRPSFFLANKMGAPYGLDDGLIRLVDRKSCICSFNSANSNSESGYSRRFGGGAVGSTNCIWCEWCYARGTGYIGSLNTEPNVFFNIFIVDVASAYNVVLSDYPYSPCAWRCI